MDQTVDKNTPTTHTDSWPIDDGQRVVFLTDVRDRLERRLLRTWVTANWPRAQASGVEIIEVGRSRESAELLALCNLETSIWLQPVRVAWLALESHEPPSLVKDFFYGRRVHPGPLRRLWLARHRPERLAYLLGAGAPLSLLRSRWQNQLSSGDNDSSLCGFIEHQAMLALERAERRRRGARYRIAKLMPSAVFARKRFQERLNQIASDESRTPTQIRSRAARYLAEMAATQTPFTLDLLMGLSRMGVRSNHDANIDVKPEQLDRLRELVSQKAVTFQITHKSMLDTVAFSLVMFEADIPIPLTFGGINLKTFGVGALARRAGVIFLRRSFQNNEVYKAVFRRYIDHLIEKRFSLLWALEGGRSRTGKLLAPRFGLFNYVLESSLRTQNLDLAYVPVSVAYDQITEVEDYAREQSGASKKAEGMGWMLRFFRRGGSHGRIYLRLGEPFSVTDLLDGQDPSVLEPELQQALVKRIALESATRLNAATPVTVPAVMTLILLGAGRRAQQLDEIRVLARAGVAILRRRKVEVVGLADFRDREIVRDALNQLHKTGIVSYFDEGLERLYRVEARQHLRAAYYRNTVIHHFLLDAIAELSLVTCRKAEVASSGDSIDTFYDAAEQIRALFEYEFFFADAQTFKDELSVTLESRVAGWRGVLDSPDGADKILNQMVPLFAHGILRAFVDAYRVVAAFLVRAGDQPVKADSSTMSDMLKLGRQMLLQEVIFSSESVSKTLYETALKMAQDRHLLVPGQADGVSDTSGDSPLEALQSARRAWLVQMQQLSKNLDQIMAMTLSRAVTEFPSEMQ
ncbi:MAG: 1-acyl-sn-glycerol-3-phosphate acyltransferase [Burkholderiaceae bacterium]